MNGHVLFAPQNDSHGETIHWLAPRLLARDWTVTALDLNGIYHQELDRDVGCDWLPSGLTSSRPFYRSGIAGQLATTARAIAAAPRWLDNGPTLVVVFNDGAVQRALLQAARGRGIRTALVLDGMISEGATTLSPRAALRAGLRKLGKLLALRRLGALLPSEVGLWPVDVAVVPGQHSADVLHRRGARAGTVVAAGLPRWSDPAEGNSPRRLRRVLYLTGAFRWHGEADVDAAQLKDVRDLGSVCADLEIDLEVRVHPRNDADAYRNAAPTVIPATLESMAASIDRADAVASMVSTGLFEAILRRKPALVLTLHAPPDRFARSFAADPVFRPIRSREQLHGMLAELRVEIPAALTRAQRDRLPFYVAATGSAAADAIVDALVRA